MIGIGEDSSQQPPGRAAAAVAGRLGLTSIMFAGGHDGFLGGEYGRTGKPDAFAATLRAIIDET